MECYYNNGFCKDWCNECQAREVKEKEEEDEIMRDHREQQQKQNKDYNQEMEKCECGSYLNSHDHCPRCDY